MSHCKKHPAGVTLIELTIAISIFSVVMMIALNSFLNVLKFNREAVQKQSIQDHTEFLFNLMSREIRTGRINYGSYSGNNSCDSYFGVISKVPANAIYWVSTDNKELHFQNYEGLCVKYFLATDANHVRRLTIARHNPQDTMVWDFAPSETREDWVLPGDIEVSDIYFQVQNMFDLHPDGPTQPPAVKYSIKLRSRIWDPSDMKIFNVVVGRNFEQF